MPIYKGSQKIKDIYYGNIKIGKIYKGSTLLYTSLAYPLDTVLFESSTPGTSTVELEKGIYEVYCIAGGGGGGAKVYTNSGGGGGSGYIGIVSLEKGQYTIVVGAGGKGYSSGNTNGGDSSISNVVTSYGGKVGGNATGAGGAEPTVVGSEISFTLKQKGNSFNRAKGGDSLYSGYGAGGNEDNDGSSGYVKIVYKGRS